MSGEVYVGILKKNNACEDINIEKSCTPLFPDKPEMLGKLIAFVAVHEIGHFLEPMMADIQVIRQILCSK
jgi:predicted Zn-dependent protease with MMP-like domain